MQPIDLDNVFSYHPPADAAQTATYQAIREGGKTLAKLIDERAPDGPEKTLAIRKIQEAVMWANAGIACAPVLPLSPESDKYAGGGFGPADVLPC